ncbi:MAG TPA: hypothetical protein VEX60_19095 [Pyrinomonadaceae bacterium]|nr:hypothetical protein [Pyrinomonadaceae bacterium]
MFKGLIYKAALILVCAAAACNSSPGAQKGRDRSARHPASSDTGGAPVAAVTPVLLAELKERAVKESSGIAASRTSPGVFWTHNDSGDGSFVYAFDREGRSRGVWRVEGARAHDWEDIACGPGPVRGVSYIYIGDIGDNGGKREGIVVYRFAEPSIEAVADDAKRKTPLATVNAEALHLKYPDGSHNAEALMVHPVSGDIYVVTKGAREAGVYKMSASAAEVGTLTRVATIRGPGFFGVLITGGDISPDGRRIALCDYATGYELRLPDGAGQNFDDIWKQTPLVVSLGARMQGEAVCYRPDGAALLATSEGLPTPLIEVTLPASR